MRRRRMSVRVGWSKPLVDRHADNRIKASVGAVNSDSGDLFGLLVGAVDFNNNNGRTNPA